MQCTPYSNVFFQFKSHFIGELILHRERVEQHCSGINEALTQLKNSYQGMLDDHARQVHQLINVQ